MALPASGELGGNTVTQAQFKTKIEDLRDEVATKANESGDATQTFKVADATNDDEAVSKSQLDSKALLGGSATQLFKAKAGAASDDVVNKGQLDTKANTADLKEIGVGQTWQDVKNDRKNDITYTNTTGKPIMINISASTTDTEKVSLFIGDEEVSFFKQYVSSSDIWVTLSAIVPSDATYRLSSEQGIINTWQELR